MNIWNELSELNETVIHETGKRDRHTEQLAEHERELKRWETRLRDVEEARSIINEIAALTQDQLSFHVAGLVTLALQSVFGVDYEMKLTFENKRGKTEARIVVLRDGVEFDPLTESGGGLVDVMSFALRVSIWHLANPRTRGIFILDEPFKMLSSLHREDVSELLRTVSEKLNVQFIVVTHDSVLAENADNVITVEQVDGVSRIVD